MPMAPARACPRCFAVVRGSKCPTCSRKQEQQRGSAHARGYTRRWDKARRHWLRASTKCVACLAAGRTTVATLVDHIVPHEGDQVRFWDTTNWQSLCRICHGIKTAGETAEKRAANQQGGGI